jgi:hypothetical protein
MSIPDCQFQNSNSRIAIPE